MPGPQSQRRTTSLTVAATLAAAAVLAGCGVSASTSSDVGHGAAATPVKRGGTLVVLTEDSNSPTGFALDPAQSWSLATTSMGLLYRRLTTWKVDRTGVARYVPDLATTTGTPSHGGRVWTYHLKPGIRFSNGRPITSRDVKYAVERTYAPPLSGGINYQKPLIAGTKGYNGPFDGKQLSSIQTPDARTVVFHLNKRYGDWPWVVSTVSMSPVPAGEAPPGAFAHHPVTSGPYMVKAQSNTQITLVRNPYWTQASDPHRSGGPSKIVVKLNLDRTVEAQTVLADGADARNAFTADAVPPAQLIQAVTNTKVRKRLASSTASVIRYVAVNMKSPKLANFKVREALQYAVDRQSVVVSAGGNIGAEPATTLITPGIAGRVNYDMYPAGPSGNVAKAKALLAQAGDRHPKLTLVCADDPLVVGEAQAVAQSYSRAGIHVSIRSLDSDAFSGVARGNSAKGYDLAISSWQPDFPSAYDNIEPLFDSINIGNGNINESRLDDPTVDRLMAQAEGTVDRKRSEALWVKTDKTIMATGAVVPLVYERNSYLFGSDVRNFYVGPFPSYPVYTAASVAK